MADYWILTIWMIDKRGPNRLTTKMAMPIEVIHQSIQQQVSVTHFTNHLHYSTKTSASSISLLNAFPPSPTDQIINVGFSVVGEEIVGDNDRHTGWFGESID